MEKDIGTTWLASLDIQFSLSRSQGRTKDVHHNLATRERDVVTVLFPQYESSDPIPSSKVILSGNIIRVMPLRLILLRHVHMKTNRVRQFHYLKRVRAG